MIQQKGKLYKTIGLMSGTSLDGIDLAYLETDGAEYLNFLGHDYFPYADDFKAELKSILGQSEKSDVVLKVENDLTDFHIIAVKGFMQKMNLPSYDIDFIGFHGHTIFHDPSQQKTIQIGDAQKLKDVLGIPVIADLRQNDVKDGGQGAPLVPIYHLALAQHLKCELPTCFINIGGISNLTYIPDNQADHLIAFDCGPGNALTDEWCTKHLDVNYDKDGECSAKGTVDVNFVNKVLDHAFFQLSPPKSLDRLDFQAYLAELDPQKPYDALRSLVKVSAQAIIAALKLLPEHPNEVILMGGGRLNKTLRADLSQACSVSLIDDLGLKGDLIEAQAFAYLAVRSHLQMPITYPMTTGSFQPLLGGKIYA